MYKRQPNARVHLRLLYCSPGRLSCIIPYHDFERTRRMSKLPALYFDNLGPSFGVDQKQAVWGPHLLIGPSWDRIHGRLAEMKNKIDTREITPLRLPERCMSPFIISPNPVRWATTIDHLSVEMLETATSLPPNTKLSALSFRQDRLPAFSVEMLSLIHISEPTRPCGTSRMPSSA